MLIFYSWASGKKCQKVKETTQKQDRKTWQQMWTCLAPGQVLASPPVLTSMPGNIREDGEDENHVEEDDDGGNVIVFDGMPVLPVLPFPS